MLDVVSIFQSVFIVGLSTFLMIAVWVLFVNLIWDFIKSI